MPRKKENHIKCVYLIGFMGIEKVYIGSTIRWPDRELEHLRDLARDAHCNRYLQRAYNKHGKDRLYIKVLEIYDCSEEELRCHEESWIRQYDSANKQRGFNSVAFPSLLGVSGAKWTKQQRDAQSLLFKTMHQNDPTMRDRVSDGLQSAYRDHPERYTRFRIMTCELYNPQGQLVKITNLNRFCREHSLDYRSMYKVATDVKIEYKGWKKTLDREHRRKVRYSLIDPDGNLIEGTNMRELCDQRGLSYPSMCAMALGQIKTSCGYRRSDANMRDIDRKRGSDYIMLSPDGQEVAINNLSAFCRDKGLRYSVIRHGYVSEGWRLKT